MAHLRVLSIDLSSSRETVWMQSCCVFLNGNALPFRNYSGLHKDDEQIRYG